jgi:hypothetical protein
MLIRYIDENTFIQYGKTRYYGDTVWSFKREADKRKAQLERANYYSTITEKDGLTGTEYSVWRSKSDRRGTSQTKTEKIRELTKEEKDQKPRKRGK